MVLMLQYKVGLEESSVFQETNTYPLSIFPTDI